MNGEVFISFISLGDKVDAKVQIYKGLVSKFSQLSLYEELTSMCPVHSSLTRTRELKLVVISECPDQEAEIFIYGVTSKKSGSPYKVHKAISGKGQIQSACLFEKDLIILSRAEIFVFRFGSGETSKVEQIVKPNTGINQYSGMQCLSEEGVLLKGKNNWQIVEADDIILNRANPMRIFSILESERMVVFQQRDTIYVKRHSDSNQNVNQLNRFSVNVPEIFIRLPKTGEEYKSFKYKLQFQNKAINDLDLKKADLVYDFKLQPFQKDLKLEKLSKKSLPALDVQNKVNFSDVFKISEGSVFEYRLEGDTAKNFELHQRLSYLGEKKINGSAQIRSFDTYETVYMNFNFSTRKTEFYRGKVGTGFAFQKIAEISLECISFDIKKLSNSGFFLAAICSEADQDYLVIAKGKDNSITSQGKSILEHDFDYVEIAFPEHNSEHVLMFVYDDRQERLDVLFLDGEIEQSLSFKKIESLRSKCDFVGLKNSINFRLGEDRKQPCAVFQRHKNPQSDCRENTQWKILS